MILNQSSKILEIFLIHKTQLNTFIQKHITYSSYTPLMRYNYGKENKYQYKRKRLLQSYT